MPERGRLDHHLLVRQTRAELRQRQIRLGLDPRPKHRLEVGQPGAPMSADRPAGAFGVHPLSPFDLIHPAHTDFKPPRGGSHPLAPLQRP